MRLVGLYLLLWSFRLLNWTDSTKSPGKVFAVDDVKRATKPLRSEKWENILSTILALGHSAENYETIGSPYINGNRTKPMIEAFSKPKDGIYIHQSEFTHGFVSAVQLAYTNHYPLVITPDDIWLCIVQGFAEHVNRNSEKLRHHFVQHDEGRKRICVRRDDFVKGWANNPWEEVFSEFSSKIRENIGEKTHDFLVPTFTTTGPIEKSASEIVLMETFEKYFEYRFYTLCGIPEIQLMGTVDDWRELREKALSLEQFELKWWTERLKPILDELVATSEGHINKEFWSSIYKLSGMSGGPDFCGWIVEFFPYIHTTYDDELKKHCLTTADLPTGISAIPFIWKYFLVEFKMKLYAGFMGAAQDPDTLSVSSAVGWIVAEDDS